MNKETNISKVFIGFLVASFLMWLLINLSKEYTTVVNYEVKYEKIAQNKILQEEPIKEIELLVKGTGFNLLSANFTSRKVKLFANDMQKKSKNDYYFLLKNQNLSIQKQLPSGLKLEQVLQDTIKLKLGSLASKKIPLLLDLDVKYRLGYDAAEKVSISPDSVVVSGPELQLAKFNSLKLESLELKDVSENISRKLAIAMPKEIGDVKISQKEATIEIIVDKFTEGEFEVPVLIENIDENVKLSIFPKNVKVVFKVGLKNFNKVTSDSFEIICDYEHAVENELTYLIPKLKSKPKEVSTVRIVPDKIDFLVHK